MDTLVLRNTNYRRHSKQRAWKAPWDKISARLFRGIPASSCCTQWSAGDLVSVRVNIYAYRDVEGKKKPKHAVIQSVASVETSL